MTSSGHNETEAQRLANYGFLTAQLPVRVRAASDVLGMVRTTVADLIAASPGSGTPLPDSRGADLLHEAEVAARALRNMARIAAELQPREG